MLRRRRRPSRCRRKLRLRSLECLTPPGSELFGRFKQSRSGEGPTRAGHQNLSDEIQISICRSPEKKLNTSNMGLARVFNFSILNENNVHTQIELKHSSFRSVQRFCSFLVSCFRHYFSLEERRSHGRTQTSNPQSFAALRRSHCRVAAQ